MSVDDHVFVCHHCGYETNATNICRTCYMDSLILVLENSIKPDCKYEPWDEETKHQFSQEVHLKYLLHCSSLTQEQAEKIRNAFVDKYRIEFRMKCKTHGEYCN